jgi:hypothetical protein
MSPIAVCRSGSVVLGKWAEVDWENNVLRRIIKEKPHRSQFWQLEPLWNGKMLA